MPCWPLNAVAPLESSLRSLVLIFYFLRDLGGSEGGLPSWACWSEKGIDTESLLPWPQVTELHTHPALWKGIQATSSVLGSPWHPCEGFFEEESEGEFMSALAVWPVLGWLGPMSSGQEGHSAGVVLPRPKPQRKHLSSGSSLLPISVQIFLFQGNSQTETKPPDHMDPRVFLLRCGQMILWELFLILGLLEWLRPLKLRYWMLRSCSCPYME